ncbi:MAG TPA: glutathione peroxidase [Acetobacteraceae bacterium]|nr:glutathione peroxidase [Acetobacteraceae bacterium]
MAAAQDKNAWDFSFSGIDGRPLNLAAFKGRVLVIANTASFCGYTYQYEGLKKLHQAEADRGVTVVGVPSQDFNQESPDNSTVRAFCEKSFGVDFPLSAIAHVRGAQAAPFYAWVLQQTGWEPSWNFNKVLIGRDGRVAGTFGSGDEPQGEKLTRAIAAALQG